MELTKVLELNKPQSLKDFFVDNVASAISRVKLSREDRPFVTVLLKDKATNKDEVHNIWFSQKMSERVKLNDHYSTLKGCTVCLCKNKQDELRVKIGRPSELDAIDFTDL